ncbi:hypothetical protein PR202_gb01006 [Eleusine coracana subsp. coracana]|uniref:F-box domain-containing protein n=1 Tax=Eleusine coracana subsp. coracana TaxID=191504 RepID=A0AAV5DVJ2_ELECO|nr:hypothetical protein PR202_gb01006 [Eleusine coracana subsp. coracana]
MLTGHRLLPGPASLVSPLDNHDILTKILTHLPPVPSSIPRISLVCRQWSHLVTDPDFLRLFRAHHRKAPLLGFFTRSRFYPALDSPDCIPTDHFNLGIDNPERWSWYILNCRHGRVLFVNRSQRQFLVWAPITGEQQRLPFPQEFCSNKSVVRNGVVNCVASEIGHVHGSCHTCPFQVILLGCNKNGFTASVYSSRTNAWGNTISLVSDHRMDHTIFCSPTVVGNSICTLLTVPSLSILQFDFILESLAVIEAPSDAPELALYQDRWQFLIAPADAAGGLTFLFLSGFTARLWKRRINSDGGAGWVLETTVDLSEFLPLSSAVNKRPPRILGFVEEDNAMLLCSEDDSFMIHVGSMRYKKVTRTLPRCPLHPFTCFYPAGNIYIACLCLDHL